MLIFNIEKTMKNCFGGYGDRILGLISCYKAAEYLGLNFKINWTLDNLENYFDFNNKNIPENKIRKLLLFDKTQSIVLKLNNYFHKFRKYNFKISSNRNWIGYFIKDKQIMTKETIDIYKKFYTNILIPKNNLKLKLNEIPNNLIGLQLRCGDKWMCGSSHCIISNEIKVVEILENVKKDIIKSLKLKDLSELETKIFITSDYINIKELSKKIFGEKLLYIGDKPKHLDKNEMKDDDYIKLYLDHLILSFKCNILYISNKSNFGRTASLINNTNKIKDIESLKELKKENLIDKLNDII